MDKLLLKLKEIRANIIFGGLLYIIMGILFILYPAKVVGTLSAAIGILLIVLGLIIFLGKLFDDENRSSGMLVGALIAVIGVWIVLNPEFTASILPIVIGVLLIVSAIQKVTMAFSAKSSKMPRWWIYLILAIIDFLIGSVCVVRAFQVVMFSMAIVGGMMIYVGITSIVTAVRISKHQNVVEGKILKEDDIS